MITSKIVRLLANANVTGSELFAILEAIEEANVVTPNVREQSVTQAALRMRKVRENKRKKLEQDSEQLREPCEQRSGDISIGSKVVVEEEERKITGEQACVTKYHADFEEIWMEFAKKVGKEAAYRQWKKSRKTVEHAILLKAVKAQAVKDRAGDMTFVPHPATWLHDGRWMDEGLVKDGQATETNGAGVWVPYGTDAGDAWEQKYRSQGKIPPRDFRGGWRHPTEWPQAQEQAA